MIVISQDVKNVYSSILNHKALDILKNRFTIGKKLTTNSINAIN